MKRCCLLALLICVPPAAALAQPAKVRVNRAVYSPNFFEPDDVDPADPSERILLLLPPGPILCQVTTRLDGQPFRAARERMVDELLAAADTDRNGQPTWQEAFANPRFAGGRFAATPLTIESTLQLTLRYDANESGLVERGEARKLIAEAGGGPTFNVQAGFGSPTPGLNRLLIKLFDADGDEILSADELRAAPEKLKARDLDDDDVVLQGELFGAALYNPALRGPAAAYQPPAPCLIPLARTIDGQAILAQLQSRYDLAKLLSPDNSAGFAPLLRDWDANGDGQLVATEIQALATLAPPLVIEVDFAAAGEKLVDAKITESDPRLAGCCTFSAMAPNQLRLTAPGLSLVWEFSGFLPTFDGTQVAQNFLNQYDKDKNGYLEAAELGPAAAGLGRQFAQWDNDGDGKVFVVEIKEFYERQQAPVRSSFALAGIEDDGLLWTQLDAAGDGRLGLRELRATAARLNEFDKNDDGRLTVDELPRSFKLAMTRGNQAYTLLNPAARAMQFVSANGQGGFGVRPGASSAGRGPAWFVRMDRNRDGDLSLREFLGTPEQFAALDADADGLIDATEASR